MVVVEVRQGAGGEETRRGEEKRGEEEEEDEKREEKEEDEDEEDEEEATDIKSNNPHLAGGEKSPCTSLQDAQRWRTRLAVKMRGRGQISGHQAGLVLKMEIW